MSWVWIVRGYGLDGGSLRKIWGWGQSVQKWYQGCWMKHKRSGMCKCVKSFWSNSKLNQTCWKELLLAMSHESSSTIHSPNGRALNGRAHWYRSLFLMSMELSMQNSCHKAKLLISTSTKTACDVWCTQRGSKEENCGKWGHGCFITTMLQLIMPREFGSFLPKITLLCWSNHPTLQIWPLVTFLCFPNSRKSSKELGFKIQKPLKQLRSESSKRSWRNPSRSPWKRGRWDWKKAFEPKEITLKATCCKIYLSNKIKHL